MCPADLHIKQVILSSLRNTLNSVWLWSNIRDPGRFGLSSCLIFFNLAAETYDVFISLNVDASFEVGNFGYRDDVDIFERIEYDIVGNRGADIGYDYSFGRVYESAYLYYMLINCNRLSSF